MPDHSYRLASHPVFDPGALLAAITRLEASLDSLLTLVSGTATTAREGALTFDRHRQLTADEVAFLIGRSRSTVYAWKDQRLGFPQPIDGRWEYGEVIQWLQTTRAESRKDGE